MWEPECLGKSEEVYRDYAGDGSLKEGQEFTRLSWHWGAQISILLTLRWSQG